MDSGEETYHMAPSLFDTLTASNTDALDNQPCITLFVLTGFVFILFLEAINRPSGRSFVHAI
jgi:hypothetical protein